MTDKFYYRIINDATNEADFYVSVDLPIKPEKLCETLCLNGYHAEPATKEEYEENTEEIDDMDEDDMMWNRIEDDEDE